MMQSTETAHSKTYRYTSTGFLLFSLGPEDNEDFLSDLEPL